MANQMVSQTEAVELFRGTIANALINDRAGLVAVLQRNGISVNAGDSDEVVLTAVYSGMAQSSRVKNDVVTYLTRYVNAMKSEFAGYAGDDFFANFKEQQPVNPLLDKGVTKPSTLQSTSSTTSTKTRKAFGDTYFGQTIATKENIGLLFQTGATILTSKLTSQANQRDAAAATQVEVATTQRLAQQQQTDEKKAKWVVPTIIGVSVIVVGVVIYFVVRKK